MRLFLALLLLVYAPLAHAEDHPGGDRLCPDVETLRAQTPDTMSGVQADIDRMRLCVERAKLIKQLDEIAKQRQEILQKVVKPQGTTNTPNMLVPIPALPVSALPTLERASSMEQTPPKEAAPAKPATPAWAIRKIWGQNEVMHAQLSDGNGAILNVVQGDVLPDGAFVQELSAQGVSLSQGGKTKDLSWEQEAAKK